MLSIDLVPLLDRDIRYFKVVAATGRESGARWAPGSGLPFNTTKIIAAGLDEIGKFRSGAVQRQLRGFTSSVGGPMKSAWDGCGSVTVRRRHR